MSSSSSHEINQEQHEGGNMEWLEPFLRRTFFGACSVHQNEQNNDLNRYCITCEQSACKHCIASGSHGEHQLLKIYRHVYKDVVPLDDMKTHIDCSRIQPYRCNKKMVIALNPLPHCGSGTVKNGSCHVCMRKLTDSDNYDFCCIACKFLQVAPSSDESDESEHEKPPKKGNTLQGSSVLSLSISQLLSFGDLNYYLSFKNYITLIHKHGFFSSDFVFKP